MISPRALFYKQLSMTPLRTSASATVAGVVVSDETQLYGQGARQHVDRVPLDRSPLPSAPSFGPPGAPTPHKAGTVHQRKMKFCEPPAFQLPHSPNTRTLPAVRREISLEEAIARQLPAFSAEALASKIRPAITLKNLSALLTNHCPHLHFRQVSGLANQLMTTTSDDHNLALIALSKIGVPFEGYRAELIKEKDLIHSINQFKLPDHFSLASFIKKHAPKIIAPRQHGPSSDPSGPMPPIHRRTTPAIPTVTISGIIDPLPLPHPKGQLRPIKPFTDTQLEEAPTELSHYKLLVRNIRAILANNPEGIDAERFFKKNPDLNPKLSATSKKSQRVKVEFQIGLRAYYLKAALYVSEKIPQLEDRISQYTDPNDPQYKKAISRLTTLREFQFIQGSFDTPEAILTMLLNLIKITANYESRLGVVDLKNHRLKQWTAEDRSLFMAAFPTFGLPKDFQSYNLGYVGHPFQGKTSEANLDVFFAHHLLREVFDMDVELKREPTMILDPTILTPQPQRKAPPKLPPLRPDTPSSDASSPASSPPDSRPSTPRKPSSDASSPASSPPDSRPSTPRKDPAPPIIPQIIIHEASPDASPAPSRATTPPPPPFKRVVLPPIPIDRPPASDEPLPHRRPPRRLHFYALPNKSISGSAASSAAPNVTKGTWHPYLHSPNC